MVSRDSSPQKGSPHAHRGWARRRRVRGRYPRDTHSSVRSTSPTQYGPTQQLRPASTPPSPQPPDNFSSSHSSPFVEPELESSWAEQMTAETAKESTQCTVDISKDNEKKQKKDEAEIASGLAALSVGKDADKEQTTEEAMDTTDVAQEDQPSIHGADPDKQGPAIENGQEHHSHSTSRDAIVKAATSTNKNNETKEEVLERRKKRMEAVTTFLNEFTRQNEASDPPGPLKTNPAPTLFMRGPEVTPYSTLNVEPYTVEELTARQFRTVYDYITKNNLLRDRVRNIQIPDKESTPTRPSDYEAVAKVVHTLQTLLELVQQTTQTFHNLAVILVRRLPLDFRFTHLMGWIHELTHGITSITVNRDILQELTLPRLFQWSGDQNYFRATLQLFNVTEETFTDILQLSSAVIAHATRMIRILEAHQMVHYFNRRKTLVTQEDEEYRFNSKPDMPAPWSGDPTSYIQTLQWWRENYSEALMIKTTNEYLQESALDRHLQEKTRGQGSRKTSSTTRRPLPAITIPQLPSHTYSSWSRNTSPARREAEPRPTSTINPGEGSRLNKRKRGADTSVQVESPPTKSCRSPPSRSQGRSASNLSTELASLHRRYRSGFPTRSVPSRAHGKVEPCVFCKRHGHYSSDCNVYPYLSDRASMASSFGMCSNCLKQHFGICIRRDPCSICHGDGHHRAFCVQNPFSIFDLKVSPEEFYDDLRFRTYRNPPRGAQTRRPYQCSYRERSTAEEADRPGPSHQPLADREPSPEASAPAPAHETGFSPANSNESW